jgi:hypothetical protein
MAANKKSRTAKPKKPLKEEVKPASAQPVQSPVPAASNLTPAEHNNIQEMLQLAKLEYMKSITQKVIKEKRREINSLDKQIKEFLGPYMLIGYDLNNQPVEIISADDTASHDALLERFRRVMFKINQNIMNSQGNDPYGLKENNDSD